MQIQMYAYAVIVLHDIESYTLSECHSTARKSRGFLVEPSWWMRVPPMCTCTAEIRAPLVLENFGSLHFFELRG